MVKIKRFLINIGRYVENVLFALFITGILVFMLRIVFNCKLSNMLFYVGLVCIAAGTAALLGNINMVSDAKYLHIGSVSPQFIYHNSPNNSSWKDSNLKFLIPVGIAGFILIIISYLLRIYSL